MTTYNPLYMTAINYDIELSIEDIITVSFYGNPSAADDSYSDAFGLVKKPVYGVVEDIQWDRSKYTPAENRIIKEHLFSNYDSIEEKILEAA